MDRNDRGMHIKEGAMRLINEMFFTDTELKIIYCALIRYYSMLAHRGWGIKSTVGEVGLKYIENMITKIELRLNE